MLIKSFRWLWGCGEGVGARRKEKKEEGVRGVCATRISWYTQTAAVSRLCWDLSQQPGPPPPSLPKWRLSQPPPARGVEVVIRKLVLNLGEDESAPGLVEASPRRKSLTPDIRG